MRCVDGSNLDLIFLGRDAFRANKSKNILIDIKVLSYEYKQISVLKLHWELDKCMFQGAEYLGLNGLGSSI